MSAVIGRLHWRGCADCAHCHPTEGGCDAPEIRLDQDYDYVECETYEPREPETQRECEGQSHIFEGETE